MPERLDRVRISTRSGDLEISWACREELLQEVRNLDSRSDAIASFVAVGASRPVILNQEGKAIVVRAILAMAKTAGGMHRLPRGCRELFDMLVGELEPTEDASRAANPD